MVRAPLLGATLLLLLGCDGLLPTVGAATAAQATGDAEEDCPAVPPQAATPPEAKETITTTDVQEQQIHAGIRERADAAARLETGGDTAQFVAADERKAQEQEQEQEQAPAEARVKERAAPPQKQQPQKRRRQ